MSRLVRIPQHASESLAFAGLDDMLSPGLGAGDAALRIFDDGLDPFAQTGSDLSDPRANADVKSLGQFARLRLNAAVERA